MSGAPRPLDVYRFCRDQLQAQCIRLIPLVERVTPLHRLVESEQQRQFGLHRLASLPRYGRECPALFACHGKCPRNRFTRTPDGEEGRNYLCAGYRTFFSHIDRPMKQINTLLRTGRYADEIMRQR